MTIKIGVYGAGVVGLTTVLQLQELCSDAQITLLADGFNQDTTSDGAAGIFRPGTSFSVGSDSVTKKVIEDSYEFYANLLTKHPSYATGVSPISGYIFSSTSEALVRNPLIEDILPVYRPASTEELLLCGGGWKYGSYYSTILTECRQFLPWALESLTGKIRTMKTRLENFEDLGKNNFDVIFNCIGLGAKKVFNDRKMVPIRGQVIKVSAPWVKKFYYCDYDTYIIPGLNNVTLGGCRNYDSYDLKISRYDSAAIMERCSQLLPGLKNAPVQREWVGLRPHRDPVRLEVENVKVNGKSVKVVHNYGHGGYGVTTAPGCAKMAVKLFLETQRTVSKM